MPIHVQLQDENGNVLELVDDPRGLVHRMLPRANDRAYPQLGCVDSYGDTTFNFLQAQRVLEEWPRRMRVAREIRGVRVHRAVARLLERCASGIHLYVKFLGD